MKQSAILFNKDHVKSIEYDHRLPPSAIGVRRVCPSSKQVTKELRRQKRVKKEQKRLENVNDTHSTRSADPIHASTGTDGNNPTVDASLNGFEETGKMIEDENEDEKTKLSNPSREPASLASASTSASSSAYFQFNVDSKLIQEEIDEIKGVDRAAYKNLPVLLSAPMTHQASKHNLLSCNSKSNSNRVPKERKEDGSKSEDCNTICVDDELASVWAAQIQQSMEGAEKLRAKEDLRPMAYRLVPESWSRLRESAISNDEEQKDHDNDEHDDVSTSDKEDEKGSSDFIFVDNIRPSTSLSSSTGQSWRDETHSIVYDCLYNQFPKLHISCGAKFGCDYLLYDGNRKFRHAFAGIRVLVSTPNEEKYSNANGNGEDNTNVYANLGHDLHLPTAYDLHGYVRGLNTAGKLALIATVIRNKHENGYDYRVAIVDLALEKILSAPTHLRKRKRNNHARREIGLNLSKVDGGNKHRES